MSRKTGFEWIYRSCYKIGYLICIKVCGANWLDSFNWFSWNLVRTVNIECWCPPHSSNFWAVWFAIYKDICTGACVCVYARACVGARDSGVFYHIQRWPWFRKELGMAFWLLVIEFATISVTTLHYLIITSCSINFKVQLENVEVVQRVFGYMRWQWRIPPAVRMWTSVNWGCGGQQILCARSG